MPSFDSWREAARGLLHDRVEPADVLWDDGTGDQLLPNLVPLWSPSTSARVRLPKRFVDMAHRVAVHRDAARWDLLYRIAFRITYEDRQLLDVFVDDDVHRLSEMDQAVRRDIHKMHAFVRFRRVEERFVAWYRPDHRILELAAPFFVERFRTMTWSILTADGAAHWDGAALTFGRGVSRADAPDGDELESLWRTYYAAMFNPARTNVRKMGADMPGRFWRDMPELREVPRLVAAAESRVEVLTDARGATPTARSFVPDTMDLHILRTAVRACEGCALFEPATQAVFGEGPADAGVVLIGEQPGDREDLEGRPFVGPAGEVLDRALASAGIARDRVYVTNAVKHFAYVERGKARIHRPPRNMEIAACRPWLDAELRVVNAPVLVCLGASAARAILDGRVRVLRDRGQWFRTRDGRDVLVTIHPSAVLRADASLRDRYFALLVEDLAAVAERLERAAAAAMH